MTFYQSTGPTPSASAMQSKFAAAARDCWEPQVQIAFRPNWLFLYGTLMDPEILQSVLHIQEQPELCNATVTGFQLKMWGVYPVLLRNHDNTVGEIKGKAYWLKSWDELEMLKAYETQAYQWGFCDLVLDDHNHTQISNARTFEWATDKEDKELEDGSFDLARFQHYFKPSLLGKPPV